MKYYLLNFTDNYADEFDVYGFKVLTEEEYLKQKESSEKAFELRLEAAKNSKYGPNDCVEIGFGTNESVEFYSFENYMDSIKVMEINEDEYNVLAKLFKSYGNRVSYGFDHFFPLEY